jgi:hypothetical protein
MAPEASIVEDRVLLSVAANRARHQQNEAALDEIKHLNEFLEVQANHPQPLLRNHLNRVFPSKCFMCEYCNTAFDASAEQGFPPAAKLVKMMKRSYGHMDNMSLAILCAEYYHKHAYSAYLGPNGRPLLPFMPPEAFLEHLLKHNMSPIIKIGEDLRTLDDMLDIIKTRIVGPQGDIDYKGVDAAAKLMSQRARYLSMTEHKLLFSGASEEGIEIDPAAAGAVADLTRFQGIVRSAQQSKIGGATSANTNLIPASQLRRYDNNTTTATAPREEGDDDDDEVEDAEDEEPLPI